MPMSYASPDNSGCGPEPDVLWRGDQPTSVDVGPAAGRDQPTSVGAGPAAGRSKSGIKHTTLV